MGSFTMAEGSEMSWERLWYGPRTGWLWVAFAALVPLSLLYGLVVRCWHLAYALGLRRAVRVEGAMVVAVGNLVVGGAGKTPVTIHLATLAQARGYRVGVLSRGYGRTGGALASFTSASLPPASEVGDEPRLIARACPGVRVWVSSDRTEAARQAVKAGAEVLLLDDGFQHRRLARDVDILIDAGEGNGWMLPAGPLREPRSGRRRATLVWGRDGRPGDVESSYVVERVRRPRGDVIELASLAGRAVVVVTAVGRPSRVVEMVEAAGARVVGLHTFRDHHLFTRKDVEAVKADADKHLALVLTTEKDAERLAMKAHVLLLEVRVSKGQDRLDAIFPVRPPPAGPA
jgi:tetraacyldisaccharide 4'-kinase